MKNKKINAVVLTMIMVASILFTGCSNTEKKDDSKATENSANETSTDKSDTASGEATQEKKTYKIGMSIDTTAQAWRAGLVEDVTKEAAKHPEVELTVTDANGSSTKQISDVEDLITKGVEAILISPIESQPLTAVCKKAYDQGIHVLVLDRALEGEAWTTFIGANNRNIGAEAGEYILNYMTENSLTKVVELQGTPGSSPCRDRSEPFVLALDGSNIEIVAQQTANWTETEAIEVTENLLQAYPKGEIDLIYAQCDVMALGALKAIKSAGRDEIKIVSIDGQKEALEAIKEGKIQATFTYPFPGAEGIRVAMKLIDGQNFEKIIDMPSELITNDNVDQYYDPNSAF